MSTRSLSPGPPNPNMRNNTDGTDIVSIKRGISLKHDVTAHHLPFTVSKNSQGFRDV